MTKIMLRTALQFLTIVAFFQLAHPAMAQGNGNGNGQASDNSNNGNGNAASPGNGQGNAGGVDNAANGNANGKSNGNGNGNSGNGSGGSVSAETVEAIAPGLSTGALVSGGDFAATSSPTRQGEISALNTESQGIALRAVQSGAAVPLDTIVQGLADRAAGQLIDAQLIEVNGFLLYSIKVMSPTGRVSTQYFYARTGLAVVVR